MESVWTQASHCAKGHIDSDVCQADRLRYNSDDVSTKPAIQPTFSSVGDCLKDYQRYRRCQPFKQMPSWALDDPLLTGRKWRQIEQFSHAIGHASLPFVEWCAGKAHLGRHLVNLFQLQVLSLEM